MILIFYSKHTAPNATAAHLWDFSFMAFQFGYALPCGRIVNSCCPFWRGIGIGINLPEMQDFALPKV